MPSSRAFNRCSNKTQSTDAAAIDIGRLRDDALEAFGAMCFWNVDPSRLDDAAFARRLQRHGNREAAKAAAEILAHQA